MQRIIRGRKLKTRIVEHKTIHAQILLIQ